MHALELVRVRLAAERDAGMPFDVAWIRATADLSSSWLEAVHETADAWARAYEGVGQPLTLRAVRELRELAADLATDVPLYGRRARRSQTQLVA